VTTNDEVQPLGFTLSPKLDFALRSGWDSWERAALTEPTDRITAWLAQRLNNPVLKEDLNDAVETALRSDELEDRAVALSEIAEIAGGHDDLVADTLWEGVLNIGSELSDADLIFDATTHLANIAVDHGEPLAAAEYYINFLNWRREADHTSDVDSVEESFEEIIDLAQMDGDPAAAAKFEFRQAQYNRLAEKDDERATTGDWEANHDPYESWS
jgi:hypothetical protein